jgi:hypothetical protein
MRIAATVVDLISSRRRRRGKLPNGTGGLPQSFRSFAMRRPGIGDRLCNRRRVEGTGDQDCESRQFVVY